MASRKQQRAGLSGRVWAILLSFCIIAAMLPPVFASAEDDDRKLKNGSFEEGQTWTKDYNQPPQADVPAWNTTAYEGKIELFRENTGVYVPGIALAPSAGSYAAELNADEESTLYQNVKTSPSSIYEWGLDHGGRTTMDTMALVIGPKQRVNPSKPSKAGRDQLMQMVDWLIDQGMTSVKTSQGLGEQLTVYSKKFAANGTFEDNAGNNAFSLTPSTIYTEEWHIWIMADGKASSGTNPWGKYGSNAESATSSGSVDLTKYNLYTVPAGQTQTLFGFVSVGCLDSKGKTYGNFLDNINFQLYHPLSGSSTTHGSAVVGGSDGTTGGTGASSGHQVTVDNNLATYVTDGQPLKVQAIITSTDAADGCEFVGLYYTTQNENGQPVTEFLQLAGNKIQDTGNLTDTEKAGKWIKSTNTNGDIIYTYYLNNLTSATDLHFIFIKSPTVTYDPNGGKAYDVGGHYDIKDGAAVKNVYSFKPGDSSATTGEGFVEPYISHAAVGQNDGWKFLGWKLTGDTIPDVPADISKVNPDYLGNHILPAVHTVSCNYYMDGASKIRAAQFFKIFEQSIDLSTDKTVVKADTGEVSYVQWGNAAGDPDYANVHRGLTMVAQWRWRQAFIPQINSSSGYTDSASGGTVEIVGVTNENYGENGGKAYCAATDEVMKAEATANPGYTFEGWYDASGKLLTTNATYSYIETKESVNTYYARFSGSVTQTYIRQVKNGDTWEDTSDNTVGTLGRYTYTDVAGKSISSTATAGSGCKFVGWYDSDGNEVTKNATLSYTTTGNATYYARFQPAYTVKFAAQTKQSDGSFKTDDVGGKVSVASVTDVDGTAASSKATANSGYKFLGWYGKNGNQLSTNGTYSTTTTSATNNVTYYARFEADCEATVESRVYLSFVAESADTQIPSAFHGRDAGTGINAQGYGLDNKFGNTISTGFKYSIAGNPANVRTIQITVNVPASSYVKVGGNSSFSGDGTDILTDSDSVAYNKGSIQQISGSTTLTYYWDASGLSANAAYGFVIDNLYAPDATATITVNGTSGTEVTGGNGVVNTAAHDYRSYSHYPE